MCKILEQREKKEAKGRSRYNLLQPSLACVNFLEILKNNLCPESQVSSNISL